jgi:hypothetical protein
MADGTRTRKRASPDRTSAGDQSTAEPTSSRAPALSAAADLPSGEPSPRVSQPRSSVPPPPQVVEPIRPESALAAPARSFPLVDPAATRAVAPPRKRGAALGAAALVALALIVLALARGAVVRSALPLALACAAVGVLVRARRVPRDAPAPEIPSPPEGPRRALVLTPESLALERRRGERTSLPMGLQLDERFGVTLLSNRRRDRLVAAITSDAGALLFATRVDADGRRAMGELLARSTVLGGDDHALDATSPDGASVYLDPDHFRELLSALGDRDGRCFERIVLSDQHGTPIVLEGSDLFVQGKHFDLRRPLEWRSILFQEPFGSAVTLYQGTWIRQAGSELVLVSLLTPAFFEGTSSSDLERAGVPELDVMATRDQRLLQATATDPPPIEQRVAMDGLFVVPLRAVLDQAPRPVSQVARAGHA